MKNNSFRIPALEKGKKDMYNGIGIGQNELKNIGMSDNGKNPISCIPKNLWHWWCDCKDGSAFLDTQDAADHLLKNMIFRFDTNLWSSCSFNPEAIKEKWEHKRHFEIVHLNCYNKISKMLYHTRKAQNLYIDLHTCLYYTVRKEKYNIFTYSCIAWFIEQLFCAVSDSC